MNRDELQALAARSLTVDVVTAGKPFGLHRTKAYEMAAAGTFPVPVLKLGHRLRVRTADLVAALDRTESVSGGLRRQETAAETHAATDIDWNHYDGSSG